MNNWRKKKFFELDRVCYGDRTFVSVVKSNSTVAAVLVSVLVSMLESFSSKIFLQSIDQNSIKQS
jgi:hypothetical protein